MLKVMSRKIVRKALEMIRKLSEADVEGSEDEDEEESSSGSEDVDT